MTTHRFYFAGALFCHKELIGNHLLAEAIRERSGGKYQANLPQKEENQLRPSPLEIRDNDFRLLLDSSLALFNFDGTELDSGTVVEFMAARFLQIPCVLFRTDFRSAGDQNADGEAWNLMCSGYPRTRVRSFGAMEPYQRIFRNAASTEEALRTFRLKEGKRTILIIGGSLGARTINNTLMAGLPLIKQEDDTQFIWQTGKYYYPQVTEAVREAGSPSNLYVTDFIKDMASAYAAADLVISRAGAGSISEFCLLRKPVILVPSPNVAEDHQTKNALALVNKGAAIYVKDSEAGDRLLRTAIETVGDERKLKELSENIAKLALPDSARIIAQEAIRLAEEHGASSK